MKVLIAFLLLLTGCYHREFEGERIYLPPERREASLPSGDKLIVVMLDAGHGGKDEGCSPEALMDEKKLTLSTVRLVEKHLKSFGYFVIQTRRFDAFVSLDERVSLANRSKSDLFVSVHFNAAKNKKAHGIEIYYFEDENQKRKQASKLLAEDVLASLLAATEAKSRGVKTAGFRVIKKTEMPAILVEAGFLTHQEECLRCSDPIYQNAIAWGIAKGIDRYLRVHTSP